MLQNFNIPAGGRQIDTKASFFRYESANSDGLDQTIRVRADGNDLGTYLPGDSIRLPVPATRWEVTPVSASMSCIVRLGLGEVDSARLAGIVSVSNRIGAGITAAYGNSAPPVGFTAINCIAAALNVKGLLIRRASVSINSAAGGTVVGRMIAAPVQPVSNIPANSYQMAGAVSQNGVNATTAKDELNYIIPAGFGVWLSLDVSGTAPPVSNWELWYEPIL